MSAQFVPKSDLTDSAIWSYMKAGVYGSKKQRYAQNVEKLAARAKPVRSTSRTNITQLIADLL